MSYRVLNRRAGRLVRRPRHNRARASGRDVANDLDPRHVLPLQEFPDLRVDFPVLHLRDVVVPFGKQPEPQVREVLAEAGQVDRRQGVVIGPPHDERGHRGDDGLGALGDGLGRERPGHFRARMVVVEGRVEVVGAIVIRARAKRARGGGGIDPLLAVGFRVAPEFDLVGHPAGLELLDSPVVRYRVGILLLVGVAVAVDSQHVVAGVLLPGILVQLALEQVRVRRVADDELVHQFRVVHREHKADESAPVVADENEFFAAVEFLSKLTDVLYQILELVLLDLLRSRREVIPPHVWRHGEVVFPELRELVLPVVREVGGAVDEQHHRGVSLPRSYVVQALPVHLGIAILKLVRDRT